MAVRKTAKGAALKRWFKEDWKDVRTGKACGRKKGRNAGHPIVDLQRECPVRLPKRAVR